MFAQTHPVKMTPRKKRANNVRLDLYGRVVIVFLTQIFLDIAPFTTIVRLDIVALAEGAYITLVPVLPQIMVTDMVVRGTAIGMTTTRGAVVLSASLVNSMTPANSRVAFAVLTRMPVTNVLLELVD